MLKILLLSSILFSTNIFSQETTTKPDPNSDVNAIEQANGLPGGSKEGSYSIHTKKRTVKMPAIIAPVQNVTPANCADSLGGTGPANFTACEAAEKTR